MRTPTAPNHLQVLQALRGRLEGPEKTALRWALNRLQLQEQRLEHIRAIANRPLIGD